MPLASLECQVSELANSDTSARPTTQARFWVRSRRQAQLLLARRRRQRAAACLRAWRGHVLALARQNQSLTKVSKTLSWPRSWADFSLF